MNLSSFLNRILIANKVCMKGACEGVLQLAERPSWKNWSLSKIVQLKNRLCEQDKIILQS